MARNGGQNLFVIRIMFIIAQLPVVNMYCHIRSGNQCLNLSVFIVGFRRPLRRPFSVI